LSGVVADGAPFKPALGLSGVVADGAPFKPAVGLSGVVLQPDNSMARFFC